MQLYFGGAEKGSYRNILLDAGVARMAINLTHLQVPKRKPFDIPELFPHTEVALYTSADDADLKRYDEFVRGHFDELAIIIGRPDYTPEEWVLEKYYPVWTDGEDLERFAYLCETYHKVAVFDRNLQAAKTRTRMRTLAQRHSVQLVAVTSKAEMIDALPWHVVIAGSWSSAARFGETQVWDGNSLRRYPAAQKDMARKKHRRDILGLGVDYESLLDGDVTTASLLAVKSWQAFEAARTGYRPSTGTTEPDDDEVEAPAVATTDPEPPLPARRAFRGGDVATADAEPRHERAPVLLPILQHHVTTVPGDVDLGTEDVSITTVRLRSRSMRHCDSCYLSLNCPGFEGGSNCVYEIPIEIKTKDHLIALASGLIEMQTQRVMFAKMGEELEGQGIDVNVSQELDRLFNMFAKLKDLNSAEDTLRLSIEASGARASAGVLSRVFGAAVGEQAKQLPGGGFGQEATRSLITDVTNLGG
jgi:hypothetical protein